MELAVTLYLVRHGETERNRGGRMQGDLDAPLTRKGVGQPAVRHTRLRPRPNLAARRDWG